MKRKNIFKASSILAFILLLILSTATAAFAATTDAWETKASMATPRNQFQTQVINGKIYAIGGNNSSGTLSSVEEYDASSNTWMTKESMSTGRDCFQTEVVNGKIYAIGGNNGVSAGTLSSVEKYDPISNKWSKVSSMHTPRKTFQSEVIDGKIYVIGGWNDDNHPLLAIIGSPNSIMIEDNDILNASTVKDTLHLDIQKDIVKKNLQNKIKDILRQIPVTNMNSATSVSHMQEGEKNT